MPRFTHRGAALRGLRPSAPLLPLLLLALLVAGFPTGPTAAEPPTRPDRPALWLSALAGPHTFLSDDMDGMYGTMGSYGLRLALEPEPGFGVLLTFGYGRDSGDPYHDSQWIQSTERSRLEVTRIVGLGFRWNVTTHPAYRFHIGGGFSSYRVEEQIPGHPPDARCSCGAVFLSLGPEFRFADGQWAVGGEVARVESSSAGPLGVNLSGFTVHAVLSRVLWNLSPWESES